MDDIEPSQHPLDLDCDEGVSRAALNGLQDVSDWAQESIDLVRIQMNGCQQPKLGTVKASVVEG